MITQKDINRFHTKYVMEPLSGCWLWTGALDNLGYGRINVNGLSNSMLAHRFSAMIHGLDMTKPVIRHLCNNPSCVNPEHLDPGTQKENMKDMLFAGRNKEQKGTNNPRARLAEQDVINIRIAYETGCYTCLQLAKKYNISTSAIFSIISRKRWKHI